MISHASEVNIRHQFLHHAEAGQENPVIISMSGIPASGKSYFVEQQKSEGRFSRNAFTWAPDDVMKALSEYQNDLKLHNEEIAFENWELPARKLALDMSIEALKKRHNIIRDMGCARQEDHDMFAQAKEDGYRIEFIYIHCPPDIAVERSKGRDHHTPKEMIYERFNALQTLLPSFITLSDAFHAFDNSNLNAPFKPLELNDIPALSHP